MKKYNSRLYARVDYALNDCNNHQDWNVVNIYPTGWRQEVCVVYYTCTDALKQEWKPSNKQMKALGVATNISNIPEKEYIELENLYQDLKKLMEG